MKQSRYDPALFMKHDEDGKLRGLIGTHVDDFAITGSDSWQEDIVKKIKSHFELGRVETGDFFYCGHQIKQDGERLVLDQDDFANDIKPLVISPARRKENSELVSDVERKMIRSYAGKLGWLGRNTRPDLLFSQIEASSCVTKATVHDLKNLSKAVTRISTYISVMNSPNLP